MKTYPGFDCVGFRTQDSRGGADFWPAPGGEVVCAEPEGGFTYGNPCPSRDRVGDGVCVALTAYGAALGGHSLASGVLLVGWQSADELGRDKQKVRVRRATVLARIPLVDLLTSGADLFGANLIRADLTRAKLRGADLTGASLTRAKLRGADLHWADLHWAKLDGADLRRTDLRWADLTRADLTGANLRRAKLRGAILDGADLRRADLHWADLTGVDLRRANLTGTKLRGAIGYEKSY